MPWFGEAWYGEDWFGPWFGGESGTPGQLAALVGGVGSISGTAVPVGVLASVVDGSGAVDGHATATWGAFAGMSGSGDASATATAIGHLQSHLRGLGDIGGNCVDGTQYPREYPRAGRVMQDVVYHDSYISRTMLRALQDECLMACGDVVEAEEMALKLWRMPHGILDVPAS